MALLNALQRHVDLEGLSNLDDARHVRTKVGAIVLAQAASKKWTIWSSAGPNGVKHSLCVIWADSALDAGESLVDLQRLSNGNRPFKSGHRVAVLKFDSNHIVAQTVSSKRQLRQGALTPCRAV